MLTLRYLSIFTLLFTRWTAMARWHGLHPLSDEFIDLINSKQNLWTAGRNFHKLTPRSYLNSLAGTLAEDNAEDVLEYNYFDVKNLTLPSNFDARLEWGYCPSIFDVRDQGSCRSCWAVASASAMTDRYCIKHKGQSNFYFSAYDIVTCCLNCGNCELGGSPMGAWKFYKKAGIVSGGHYNSTQGCKPYKILPCGHNTQSSMMKPCTRTSTPKCQRRCIDTYKIKYKDDKRRNDIRPQKLQSMIAIQKEIYLRGPVTATFELYEDFYSYKYGIYKQITGEQKGLHSVKLIGWGTQNGVDYWIATNTWNADWGDEGFFKILRGSNHCKIEKSVVAG